MYLKRLLQQKRIEQVISLLQKRLYYNSDYDILYIGIRVTNKAHSKNRFKTGYSTQVGYKNPKEIFDILNTRRKAKEVL